MAMLGRVGSLRFIIVADIIREQGVKSGSMHIPNIRYVMDWAIPRNGKRRIASIGRTIMFNKKN